MELTKRNIHRTKLKCQGVSQVTLDEDVIVSDAKEDMESVICDWAEVEIEETRRMGNRLQIRGSLCFQILYQTQKQKMVDCMEGRISLEETIHISEADPGDLVRVEWELEDLTTTMIHSRKVNVKSLVTLTAMVETECVESIAMDARDSQGAETVYTSAEVAQTMVQLRDTYRVKEEVELSGNKPNIARILWSRLEPRGMECRPLDGKLSIHGEMELFCIYKGQEEHIPLQWIERSIPFSGALEVAECRDDMVPDIRIRPVHRMVEAKEDYDGEMRMIAVEAVLELEVRLYREERMDLLQDVYCPGADVDLQMCSVEVDRLVTRNASKYKMTETLPLGGGHKILQLCHVDGSVKVDRVIPNEEGLLTEGTLCVDVLYVAAEDLAPVRCARGMLPFHHTIAVMGMPSAGPELPGGRWPGLDIRVKPGLEQLHAMVLGDGQVEIKAMITLDGLVMERMIIEGIDQAQIVPLDPVKLDRIPGMVGYVVQKGDTLWKIAKKYYASVDHVKEINELSGEELIPGQKLLIVKQVDPSY